MIIISKNGLKRFIVYSLVLFLIFIVFSPFIINQLVNSSFLQKHIILLVEKKAGKVIDTENLIISVFPQPRFQIDAFSLHLDENLRLDIDRLEFVLNFQSLLKKQLKVDRISVDHPHLHSLYKDKETSSIAFYTPSLSELGSQTDKIFSYLPEHQKTIVVEFKNVKAPFFESMEGNLFLSKGSKQIILKHTVNNFRLTDDYLKQIGLEKTFKATELSIEKANSVLKLNTSGTANWQTNFHTVQLLGHKKESLFQSDYFEAKMTLTDSYQHFEIPFFNIQSPQAIIGIEFENDFTKSKSSLIFKGKEIHIDQARKNVLSLIKGNDTVDTLFEVLQDGFVHEIEVSFSSPNLNTLINEHRLLLQGSVENGKVNIPETDLTVSQIKADVTMGQGVLSVRAQSGLVENSQIQKGSLDLDLLNYDDYPFNGEFDLDVDLSQIPKVLISLLEDSLLTRELKKVSHLTGQANAKLNLNWESEAEYPEVIVKTHNTQAKGKYQRIPGDLQIDTLSFGLHDDIITLNQFSGSLLNSRFKDLNATIDLGSETKTEKDHIQTPFIQIRSGTGAINLERSLPWVIGFDTPKAILTPLSGAKGRLSFTQIKLSGPVTAPEQWDYTIQGSGNDIEAHFNSLKTKIFGLSGKYQLSDSGFTINDASGVLPDLNLLTTFLSRETIESIRVPVQLSNVSIQHSETHSQFSTKAGFNTGPELSFDLSGKTIQTLNLDQLNIKEFQVSDATIIPITDEKKKRFTLLGKLNLNTLRKMIFEDSVIDQQIKAYTDHRNVLIHSDPKKELHVNAEYIDLSKFLSMDDSVALDQFYTPDHIINFKSETAKVKKLNFSNLDARLAVKPGHSYVRLKNAYLCDIKTSGYLNFKDSLVLANFPFEAKQKPNIQDLLSCLFGKEKFMDGQYSLSGHIDSSGPQSAFTDQLKGGFEFQATEGRIYKLTLLSRILSVINVSSVFKGKIPNILQTGFAYNDVSIDGDIKEGKIHLKNAVIDGVDMTMIFTGWIDPFHDELELTCLVAPFKTIDVIIKHIPIINTLFGGRLISIPVKATGKVSDPKVIPLHPSLVGKGIVDKMSNVLKTPVKLWDKVNQ